MTDRDIDSSSENVLSDTLTEDDAEPGEVFAVASSVELVEDEPVEVAEETGEGEAGPELFAEDGEPTPLPVELSHEHAAGDLHIPDGYAVLEGVPEGGRRAVGVVVARFNGSVTTRLLERALDELSEAGVRQEAITVMVVPGAFELPLAATALAKTRRFACIVALGCVIRGDTPHFDYVASETASGLQLAALETGVPVSFGVLTLDRVEQAEPRIEKGAGAVRSALEMADLFAHLRAAATR
jgi:6,7-dimethyl-8-ribityllumazine synthase